MSYIPCPLSYFYQVGFCKGIVFLGGVRLEGVDQGFAVGEDNDMATSYVVVEVPKGLLYSQGFPTKRGPFLLIWL